MRRMSGFHVAAAVIAGALALPALAEQTAVSCGASACSTSARLNFSVVIPKFLKFGVGTGANISGVPNTTQDTITFDLTSNSGLVGNGTAVAASAPTPVAVVSNGGQVSVSAQANQDLTASGVLTIPIGQISVTNNDNSAVPAPTIVTSGPTSVNVTLGADSGTVGTGVTRRSANWTFSYANTTIPAAGTYSALVTYTAVTP